MRDPDTFDAFYRDARERLLAQTFALTGDLAASRRAVRDAFVVAWHHWRKLSQHDDPESVVRPRAWRLAQRRHTARVWYRDKDISPEVRATLDALGKLSVQQRRALVLTQLSAVSMPQMAREVGVPLEVAERELQHATDQLALQLGVQTPALRTRFDDVAGSVAGTVRWPRATIVRRAGAARRRTHTGVGVVGAVAALVVSGSLVTNAAGVRPTLDRPDLPDGLAGAPGASATAGPDDAAAGVTEPPPPTLTDATMLTASQLGARYDRTWSVARTDINDEGTGLVLPCQLERYADPRGAAAMVRTFDSEPPRRGGGDAGPTRAVQLTEASSSLTRAKRTFRTTTSWFGDCRDERVQLLATGEPRQVGDQAVQVVLRSYARPQRTYVVGVARTGVYTTTTVLAADVTDDPGVTGRRAAARLLSGAVDRLCSLPDAGACGDGEASIAARPPLPAGVAPAMLSEIDLPPVPGVAESWVGTEPRTPLTNDAASSCDSTSFRGEFDGAAFTNNATRTFVIPEADLSTEFGLTETVGSLPGGRAAALVEEVRRALGRCDDLSTDVTQVARADGRDTSLTAWRIELEVTDNRTVTFLMSVVRDGTSVAQLGLLPDTPDDLGTEAFVALSQRALERLGRLPGPRKAG
jgi:DNA-directed RNA polymerase specialized sigma24 family protein